MKQYPHFAGTCGDFHDVVKDYRGPAPEIVALCGSRRFRDAFRAEIIKQTLAGRIVLAPGVDPTRDLGLLRIQGVTDMDALHDQMVQLHRRQIDLCDLVRVINVGGYIGETTATDIEYAYGIGRRVEYVELPLTAGTPNQSGERLAV